VNNKDKRLGGLVALPVIFPIAFGFIYEWSLWLLLAGIALLGNAYVMCLRLRLADANDELSRPSDVVDDPPPPPPAEEPVEKAFSGARDFLDYLFPTGHQFRGLMARDLARAARDSGRHDLAQHLRDGF
jgi:hypothetical protein